MKLTRIAASLRAFFRPRVQTASLLGSIAKIPAGITPDNVGMWGLFGFMQNVNEAIDMDLLALIGGTATTITLTGAQFINGIIDYSGSPGGGVTLNTPSAAQIIAALPNTIPGDGFNFILYFINDNAGQTVTVTAGANVTISGNNTVATNTQRQFLVNVNVNAGTVTMVNMGTQNL